VSTLVLVIGPGRSGTSLMTGTLGRLGFHVPQPEVEANESNPRGFGEPRWVVDLHTRLLRAVDVWAADAHPQAQHRAAAWYASDDVRAELRSWLRGLFAVSDRVVVKDPRLLWFVPLWEEVSAEVGASVGVVCMLRQPAEVVGSMVRWYGHISDSQAGFLAGWVNGMLVSEACTRHLPRCFVDFGALRRGWVRQVERIGEELGVPGVGEAIARGHAGVDALHDGRLHRSKGTWRDLDVGEDLLTVATGVWHDLCVLATHPGDRQALDRLRGHRDAYDSLYQRAEAIAATTTYKKVRSLQRELSRPPDADTLPRLLGNG
jgi:hypothetical protein